MFEIPEPYKCQRCGWRWIPKGWQTKKRKEPPHFCPGCKREDWNRRLKRPGVKRKYEISRLEIGEVILIPWPMLNNGTKNRKAIANIYRAIYQEEDFYGKTFVNKSQTHGLEVTRLADHAEKK